VDRNSRMEKLVPILRQAITILGDDPNRDGLQKTPERWAEALLTYTQGLRDDPQDHLKSIFQLEETEYPVGADDMIIVDNIEFVSTCEHHIAPFHGVAHISYIPNAESRIMVGFSDLSRVVEVFARRLQIQERMTQQIAEAIYKYLDPAGVIVVVQATHYCMIQRGVKQRTSATITTARRGLFSTEPNLEIKFQGYLRVRIESSQV
jgi:GTP cyclohydrolase I